MWLAISKRFQREEEPWKIVALWDGFAQEEERRCSKIVMSMNGQLAYLGMSFTAFDDICRPFKAGPFPFILKWIKYAETDDTYVDMC